MDIYKAALKNWLHHMYKEPHHVIFTSIVFIILSLPVITIGFSTSVCISICRNYADSREVKLKKLLKEDIKSIAGKSMLMGIVDLVLLVLAMASAAIILHPQMWIGIKIMNSLYLGLDVLVLISYLYRYSILVCNQDLNIVNVYLHGALCTLNNMFSSIMLILLACTTFIACFVTGLGIFFIFPGAVMMLAIYSYRQVLAKAALS
jgi:hypothetical protein